MSVLILGLGMWVLGTGIFHLLSILILDKYNQKASWQGILTFSIFAGLVWTIIGAYLSRNDDKIADGNKAIRSAVKKVLGIN